MLSSDDYQRFRTALQKDSGILLGDNKQYLVTSRLMPLLSRFNCDNLSELIAQFAKGFDRRLRQDVIDAMTTNETLWFRDSYPFSILQERLLPELLQQRQKVRIWSSASSSGQEAYSISIVVEEFKQRNRLLRASDVEILGTDICTNILEVAREGCYDALALNRGLSDERKHKYFTAVDPQKGRWQVKDTIKRRVQFKHLNLLENYRALGKFDVIFCRNVLIYFSAEMKADIINRFADALKPEGYLILGASESVSGLSERFEMIHCRPGIIYKLKH